MKNRVSGRYFVSYCRSKQKKAKFIKQLQKEHPAGASTLTKLRVNQGKIGVSPVKANLTKYVLYFIQVRNTTTLVLMNISRKDQSF